MLSHSNPLGNWFCDFNAWQVNTGLIISLWCFDHNSGWQLDNLLITQLLSTALNIWLSLHIWGWHQGYVLCRFPSLLKCSHNFLWEGGWMYNSAPSLHQFTDLFLCGCIGPNPNPYITKGNVYNKGININSTWCFLYSGRCPMNNINYLCALKSIWQPLLEHCLPTTALFT